MKIVLLGSGAAAGMPAWNDGFGFALSAREPGSSIPRRAGLALAISADAKRFSILEAPLSLPSQLTMTQCLAPRPESRAVPLDTLVITDSDLDSIAGLLSLRAGASFRIASPHALRTALIESCPPFATLETNWAGFQFDRAFPLDREGQLEARFFPLPGPEPDYLRDTTSKVGRARAGLRIVDQASGLRVVWAPRISRLDSGTLAELRAAEIRFVDGRFLGNDEVMHVRPGARMAQDLGHLPVEGREGSLSWLSGMSGRSIYVGLGGSNPLVDPHSDATARIASSGIEIGFDGLEIVQ